MLVILNGGQGTSVPPGSVVRVAIKQAPGEVLLSPTLALGLQSWRDRFIGWAETLAETPAGVVPISAPSLAGDPRLSTQVLVVDLRTRGTAPSVSGGALARAIEATMPLGADLRMLDLSPPQVGSQAGAMDRDRMAQDLARLIPVGLIPDLPGLPKGSSTVLLGLAVVAGIVFLAGRGLKDLRGAVS